MLYCQDVLTYIFYGGGTGEGEGGRGQSVENYYL
jgi:hypothetical protein